jgi:iron(III) transport system substrate-binding protein
MTRTSLILALALAGALLFPLSVPAQQLTAAEKLYAELASLPLAEREKRLYEGAKKEGTVVITRGYAGTEGLNHLRLFEKRYPELKVSFSILSTAQGVERLIQEETAGRHLTDNISVTSPDLAPVLEKNLAARNPTPVLNAILSQYKGFLDPSGQARWVPWSGTSHGIGYNTSLLDPKDAPKSWMDLCDPKYKGMFSLDPVEVRFILGTYHVFGDQVEPTKKFFECLSKNDPIILFGHSTRSTLLLAGDHALSPDLLIWHGELDNKKNPNRKRFRVAYEAPVIMDASVLVLNPNLPHPYAGALYTDWTAGEESQTYMYDNFREVLTRQHPFFPDDAKVVPSMYADQKIVDELYGYWTEHMKKR